MLQEKIAPVDIDADATRQDARLEAVHRLDVLDTPREEGFDRIVNLIRNIFDVPIGVVSVIDAHRQWFKACDGLAASEVPLKSTMCQVVLREAATVIVPDARLDPRFARNPHVVGEPFVRFYAGVPLRTRDGHDVGTVCAIDFKPREFSPTQIEILTDLARMAMAELELRQIAAIDTLTGALSRREFRERATRDLALAKRHKTPLSCISLDIDHFKAINDGFGHAAGDGVLSEIARLCIGQLRETDYFGRLGGEEFGMLLPQTGRSGALDVAEKLRVAIANTHFDLGAERPPVTASFGVASLEPGTTSLDELLAHADAAVYDAKAQGRNRVSGWRPAAGAAPPRRRVLKAGLIAFNNHHSTVDCTVRSLSEEGAGLDISSAAGLPSTFQLIIRADHFEATCRVLSTSARHVEVEFEERQRQLASR